MKKKLSSEIVNKFLNNQSSEEEMEIIYAWYNSFEKDKDDLSDLSAEEIKSFKVLMLNNIRNNIRNNINTANKDKRLDLKIKKPQYVKSLIYFAVSSAAILFVVFLLKFQTPSKTSLPDNAPEVNFANNTAITNKVILPDGSKVWLSPKSKLIYLKSSDAHSRKVTMIGEAFFEVVKDHKRPFSIYSGNVITKVWGTSFKIRSYKNDLITKVEVVTGKVSVTIQKSDRTIIDSNKAYTTELILLPNQEAIYDNRSNQLQKNLKISDPIISIWKKASLSFDNTPISTVFNVLNKKFDVHIWSRDEKINSDFLKADFTNENLPEILEIIKKTLEVSYVVNQNEYILERNK